MAYGLELEVCGKRRFFNGFGLNFRADRRIKFRYQTFTPLDRARRARSSNGVLDFIISLRSNKIGMKTKQQKAKEIDSSKELLFKNQSVIFADFTGVSF